MKLKYKYLMCSRLTVITLLLILPAVSYSQEAGSCAENLQTAQTLFEKGQVEQVPGILAECMKSGFTREESLSAYRLLIQSYLFEDKIAKADSTMMAFLKINPEYEISPTDHSSFVNLFRKYKVKPVVQLGFHIGTNVPFVTFVGYTSLLGEPGGTNKYSIKPINLFASVEAKFELTKRLELNVEPGYSQIAFTNTETDSNKDQILYTENQKRFDLPVTATYNLKSFGKFSLYARLGGGPTLTLSSLAKVSVKAFDVNGDNVPEREFDRKDARPVIDLFVQAGAGIKFKTRGGFLTGEVRSNTGLINQSKGGGVNDNELYNAYRFVDDNFHLNAINICFGYTRIFYKPTKREE